MKKTIKLFWFISLLAIIGLFMTACNNLVDPDDDDGNQKDFAIVNISQETDFDYLFLNKKDGSRIYYNIDEDTGLPTRLYIKPKKDSDVGATFLFKENGLPDKVITNGHVFLMGNFREYQYDMAIISPNGDVEYAYNIETDINWDANREAFELRQVTGTQS